MSNKTAIITGISGQDGAYLASLLLNKGYAVVGFVRSYTTVDLKGLEYLHIRNRVIIEECDLLDISQIIKLLYQYTPTEIYNLAAQSSVSLSFKQPIGTFHFNTISVFNLLEAIKLVERNIKFYQASSSEMYGRVEELPITEKSVLHPVSPYAISKAAAHWTCIHYRESYQLFVCCGILFNHESFLRNENFFIKKVMRDSVKIKNGQLDRLLVGNIDIKRDFGYAPRYVEGMHLMMQSQTPKDYILCSGQSTSLRSILEHVFSKLGIDRDYYAITAELYRPADIDDMYGNSSSARSELGWDYQMTLEEMLDTLLTEELNRTPILNRK
ncbi:MAG TPA: GDP-mannose 4,6-dehydratase [Puia sp.]|nr:GDP-mannose 4,6-dehydratase [Puia sp.]